MIKGQNAVMPALYALIKALAGLKTGLSN